MHLLRLACLLLLASPLAFADEHKGVRFTPPAGWESVENGDARVLVAPGQADDEALVVLLAPAEAAGSGSPAEQMKQVAARINEGAEVGTQGALESRDLGARGGLHLQQMQVTDGDVGVHTRVFALLISGGKRAVVVLIVKPDAVLERHQDAVAAFLSSLELVGAEAPKAAAATKLPTGDTPELFPGSPGWLPSGRGIEIPAARLVNGKPEGIWFRTAPQNAKMIVREVIYLPDGTRASDPRPGGANLFDLEGQKKQHGTTGVGTFELKGETFVERYGEFTNEHAYTHGSDGDGPFFKLGQMIFRPLAHPTREGLIGEWTTPGGKWVFKADGTYETGYIGDTGDFIVATSGRGTWELDGYLIAIRPEGAPSWINVIGAWNQRWMMFGTLLYQKQ